MPSATVIRVLRKHPGPLPVNQAAREILEELLANGHEFVNEIGEFFGMTLLVVSEDCGVVVFDDERKTVSLAQVIRDSQ